MGTAVLAAPPAAMSDPHGTRGGLVVVGITLVVGLIVGVVSFARYKHSVETIEDLFTGLVYFLEDHAGRFPASADEFLKSDFVKSDADGRIRISGRPASPYRPHAYGVPIDLARMHVTWGVDLSALRLEKVLWIIRDPSDHDTMLIGDVSSIQTRRKFTLDLIRVHCAIAGAELPVFERYPQSTPTSAASA